MFQVQLALGACFLLLVGAAHAGYTHPCSRADFIAQADSARDYFACEKTSTGGYSLRPLRCQDDTVFDSQLGRCVNSLRFIMPADGGDIENPTIPPDNLEDSTTEKAVTTAKPDEPTTAPTTAKPDDPTTAPTTAKPDDPTTAPTTAKPDDPTTAPTTAKPDDPTTAPTTAKPDDPTTAPTTAKPDDPTTAPTTAKPDDPTTAPTTAKPDEPTTAPTTAKPDDPTTAPTTAKPDDPTTVPTTSGPTDAPISTTTKKNVCTTKGSIPKPGNCKQYVLCYETSDDDVVPITLDCPDNMEFSPWNRYCMANYDCATD
ncbi:proteoglycan 4 [Drosophila innubila]|uniref:proteoglycan 4 n=1 Tax=Drosophila innubila TaxID=198719 RepID=UPI00148C23C0|nr:proteoglycan 4 [Drosophila innubila]